MIVINTWEDYVIEPNLTEVQFVEKVKEDFKKILLDHYSHVEVINGGWYEMEDGSLISFIDLGRKKRTYFEGKAIVWFDIGYQYVAGRGVRKTVTIHLKVVGNRIKNGAVRWYAVGHRAKPATAFLMGIEDIAREAYRVEDEALKSLVDVEQ